MCLQCGVVVFFGYMNGPKLCAHVIGTVLPEKALSFLNRNEVDETIVLQKNRILYTKTAQDLDLVGGLVGRRNTAKNPLALLKERRQIVGVRLIMPPFPQKVAENFGITGQCRIL